MLNVNRPDWNPRGVGFDPDSLPDGRTMVFNDVTGPPGPKSFLGSRMRIFVRSGKSLRQLIPDAVDPAVPDYADREVAYARATR